MLAKTASKLRSLNVLLVDGKPSTSSGVWKALARAGVGGRVHTVGDHCEALAYLRKDRPYLTAPLPDIVVFGEPRPEDCQCDVARELENNAELARVALLDEFDVDRLVDALEVYDHA